MNTRPYTPSLPLGRALAAAIALLVLVCGPLQSAHAQSTSGGTSIVNQASASYSDGTETYTTVSNTVTVTVANVSGLAITPDAGSVPSVVAGQTSVDFTFTVTNSGNFATQVRFLASGASIALTGPATLQAAVIDTDNNGIDAGDTDVLANGAAVDSASLARNASFNVIVRVNVNAAAAAGSTVSVRLGDAAGGAPSYDNQSSDGSAGEVRTMSSAASAAPVNGESEARGDISTTVENDAQLRLSINYPAGPVALGSAVAYTYSLENTGQRTASQQTLLGAPAGSNTGVFVVVPVPVDTDFTSITPPGGVTVLYSTSAITNDPLGAGTVWTTVPPASGVTRVAFNVGASLAAGATVNNLQLSVTVRATANASTPIYAVGDAFARNTVSANVTDQSGDAVAGKGDGNANFDEPRLGTDAATGTQGFRVPTTLLLEGSVLIGPSGFPAAVGPTDTNDDYTNKSVAPASVAGLGSGDSIAASATVDFVNTVRNTGNGNDTFTLTAPTVPAGFTVQVDAGSGFVTLSGGGSTTLALAFGAQANVTVRVTAPAGSGVLNGFAVTIQAESANTAGATNRTIDRLYTGFLRLTKAATVINNTGVGNGPSDPGADDAVPGALIEYVISYENISSGGGTNCVQLTASSVVITENGNVAPNTWGATTDQVVGSASDSRGAVVTGDVAGSTLLTDPVGTLGPGQSGTFTFRRQIK